MESRRVRIVASSVAALVVLLVLVVGAFPFGLLHGTIERRLSAKVGRPVTIGSIDRTSVFSFSPTVLLRDVTIPQPAWAGQGDLATIRSLGITFPVWPLLFGRFTPHGITADGLHLALRRNAVGLENWRGEEQAEPDKAQSPLRLDDLRLIDATLDYRDDKRQRTARLALSSDDGGFRAAGPGTVHGLPVRIAIVGPKVRGDRAWPVTARIDGAARP